MTNNHSNRPLKTKSVFPYCLPTNTYGTTLFWAEEYWAVVKIHELVQKYPNIDFSGLIDPYFRREINNLLKGSIHEKILGTKTFNDISDVTWQDNRRSVNIATSHAPSRFIALDYWERFGDDFGIVTFDAHLDLSDSEYIHGAWINKDLACRTAVIGGWAEPSSELLDAHSSLAFLSPSIDQIATNQEFIAWLEGKKIYLSLDLDYYNFSQTGFLGYSNFWHRNKIIGHSKNLEQDLELKNVENQPNDPILLGKLLGFFPNLGIFIQNKKSSIKKQSNEITNTLRRIVKLCRKNSTKILSIDFVEYSPTCDWQQLTIKEFLNNYSIYSKFINS